MLSGNFPVAEALPFLYGSCQTICAGTALIREFIPVLAKQHYELIRTVDKQKSPEVKLRGIQTFK
jgi:hypothetical protein